MRPLADLELQLHRDAAALRSLARELVGDPHLADDVVQEAVQRTLQRPPDRPGRLGAFLQTVVTHLCFQHRRRQRRRTAREQVAARPERVEPTLDLAARREALRSVTTAVFALEEPYQGTILLRYFEDLSPTEIAARTQTSVATVKSRLQRGLALLRARMQANADGSDWRRALAAATGIKLLATGTLVTTGAILMGPTAKIAIGAAAVAAGAALVYALTTEAAATTPTPAPAEVTSATAQPQAELPTPTAPERRIAVPTEEPEPPPLAHPFAYDLQIEARDRDGLPVAGAQIHLAPVGCALSRVPLTTGPDGVVHAQWRGKLGEMEMAMLVDGQPMLRRFVAKAGPPQRLVVEGRAGGGQVMSFRIVSGNGTGSSGEMVLHMDGKDLGQALSIALTDSLLVSGRSTASDLLMQSGLHPHAVFADALLLPPSTKEEAPAQGVQVLRNLPVVGMSFTSSAVTFETVATRDSESKDGAPPPTVLDGVVYDEDGKPVPKCTVCWGEIQDQPTARMRTDDQGRFHFDNVKPGAVEVRAGGRDAGLVRARIDILQGKTTSWQARLRRETVIRGHATDLAGKPLEGWTVEAVGAQSPWFDACSVRKDGTFVLPNQPGGITTLLLRPNNDQTRLPVMIVGDVLPDSGDTAVRFDPTTIAGQMQITPIVPEGLPVQAEVRVWQEETGRGASMEKAENSPVFAIRNLPAGWYRVEVGATSLGWVDAGRHWVDGKSLVELGKVGLGQPGRVRIQFAEGSVPVGEKFEQQVCQRRPGLDLRVEDATTAKGGDLLLPAGDYWLLWRDLQGRRQLRPFHVDAGRDTLVEPNAGN